MKDYEVQGPSCPLNRAEEVYQPETKQQPFRRTSDKIQYQVFKEIIRSYEKTLGLLKWTIIAIFLGIIFLFNAYKNDTTSQDYQLRLLNDIIHKMENYHPHDHNDTRVYQPQTPEESLTIIKKVSEVSHVTKQCAACHNQNNTIRLYEHQTYKDFTDYIRGKKRFPQNNVMPKYTEDLLTEYDIRKIYEILGGK